MSGILARKIGMARAINPETGEVTAVTVLHAPEAEVLQVKDQNKDGYEAVVLGSFPRKNFGKNENKKFKEICEFKIEGAAELKKGGKVGVATFEEGADIKITGTSKGRGFAGVVKRHNFSTGRNTHGSHHHREPGSVGMCSKPGRILKGKKMPGHYGNTRTTFCTKIINIDADKSLIAVRGGIPGAKDGFVTITTK